MCSAHSCFRSGNCEHTQEKKSNATATRIVLHYIYSLLRFVVYKCAARRNSAGIVFIFLLISQESNFGKQSVYKSASDRQHICKFIWSDHRERCKTENKTKKRTTTKIKTLKPKYALKCCCQNEMNLILAFFYTANVFAHAKCQNKCEFLARARSQIHLFVICRREMLCLTRKKEGNRVFCGVFAIHEFVGHVGRALFLRSNYCYNSVYNSTFCVLQR